MPSLVKTYRPYEPNQSLLLPPSLDDWLPANHPARFVGDAIDDLDLAPLYESYEREERGYPPYEPLMMLKVLTYGYMVGVRSSRKLQQAVEDQIAFRYLAAGNFPNWRTINGFRARHTPFFKKMFKQVVQLAMDAGLVGLRVVAGDGTKMKGNASLAENRTLEKLREEEAALDRYVDAVVAEADANDAQENDRYKNKARRRPSASAGP
jgi:transposase